MTYVPSSALAAVLERVRVGLWIDSLQDGRVALVCKMPELAIKALHRGVGCSFLISIVKVEEFSILCLGIRVEDEPENPFTTTIPTCSSRDLAILKEILSSRSTTLHCLNELNHPTLSAWCSLESATAQTSLDGLNSTNPYLLTPSTGQPQQPTEMLRVVELALDRFQKEIYRPAGEAPREFVEATGKIPLSLSLWQPVEVFEVSPTLAGGPFRIDDQDEGQKQERSLHLLIDSVYPRNTYRSPRIQDGGSMRELIDVLGLGSDAICLLESKGMAILSAAVDRSSHRRAAMVTKYIAKGLRQLKGALTTIRLGGRVYDADGLLLKLPGRETLPAHAIVLLSEMYAFVDWQRVAAEAIACSENDRLRALFQVMDVSELSYLVKLSKDARAFNERLIQRWFAVRVKGTAYLRVKIPDQVGDTQVRPPVG